MLSWMQNNVKIFLKFEKKSSFRSQATYGEDNAEKPRAPVLESFATPSQLTGLAYRQETPDVSLMVPLRRGWNIE